MKRNASPYPYRKGKVRPPSERRVRKTASRPLSSFNVMLCYATMFTTPPSAAASFRYVATAAFKFFIFQYMEKLHLLHIPVKHVDHALDSRIPFRPDSLHIYMDFINYWIRCMAMLEHRFGIYNGSKLCAEYLRYLTLVYDEAYRLYRECMTTTQRPPCDKKRIAALRKADPHYMCVPSLHIAIICLTFSFYRMLFVRERFTKDEKERWGRELYIRAVQIAESVLYLKQHSVNCIPAALYMLTRIVPELFTPTDATAFIHQMFSTSGDISAEEKKAVAEYMDFMYERFLLEGCLEDDWRAPVLRWLGSYQPSMPQEQAEAPAAP